MTDFIVSSITNPAVPVDSNRPMLKRHPLLDTDVNSGVRALFSTYFSFSYPGGGTPGAGGTRLEAGDPSDGQTIRNVAATDIFGNQISGLADGTISVTSSIGGSIEYAGGGFDYTDAAIINTATQQGCGILTDPSVCADLFAAYSGSSQQYLMCGLFKLPAQNDAAWSGKVAQETILGSRNSSTLASVGNVNVKPNGHALSFIRQTALGSISELNMTGLTPGGLCLIGAYRTATASGLYYQSATERRVVTAAAGANNTADFSGALLGAGYPLGYTNTNNAVNPLRSGLRNYEMMVENLARSSRDPVATMDAYWSWVVGTLIPWDIARHGAQTILI